MAATENNTGNTPVKWSIYKKIAFRIAFVFFLLVSIPLSGGWYKSLAAIDWLNPHYRDIYSIARYGTSVPSLFSSSGRAGSEGEDGEGGVEARPERIGRPGKDGASRGGRNRFSGQSAGRRDSVHVSDGRGSGRGRTNRKGRGGFGRRRDSLNRQGDLKYADNAGNTERRARWAGQRAGRDSLHRGAGGFGRRHRRDSLANAGVADSSIANSVGSGERRRGGFGRRHRLDSLANAGGGEYAVAEGSNAARKEGFRRRQRGEEPDSAHVGQSDRRRQGNYKFAGSGNKNRRQHNRDIDTAEVKNNRPDSLRSAGFGANRDNPGNGNAPQQARSRGWLSDYTSWGNALVIAVIIGLIWTLLDRKRPSYNVLYYWLTVVVRFRAAIGIIGFGFTKLFPTQMPFPSLGLLNTDFGDFTAQKIYWMSVGIVPWYQVFGGIVEVLAGLLLFFKKTATYGAILLIGALGDITFVNYSYDGGVHVYAFYFVLLGSFVVAADVPRLYSLLILERYTVRHFYYPDYSRPIFKYTRIGLKGLAFLIFFVVLTYTEVVNFKYDPYKQPSTAGVKTLRGNYNVTEFKINGQAIPYSPLDSVRWKEATFEKWTTLTFRVNKAVVVDPSNGGGSPMRDIQRTFEIAGTAGGQRAFHYYADTIEHVLYLQDKNAVASRGAEGGNRRGGFGQEQVEDKKVDNWISDAAWKNIGDENRMIDKRAWSTRRDREFARPVRSSNRAKMILKYSTIDGKRVILTGIDENKDSLYVVLDKADRKYILPESTLSAGKY